MYVNLEFPAYRPVFAASILVAAAVGVWGLRRAGLSFRDCLRVQVTTTAAGLLGAKLFSIYERGGYVWSLTSEITQGYRYPGAIIGVAAALVVLSKWPPARFSPAFGSGRRGNGGAARIADLADALAPSVGIGAALIRLGCFAAGCCFGVRSELPWAMGFPAHSPPWDAHLAAGWIGHGAPTSFPVHPLQLYFLLLSLGAAALCLWLQPRKAHRGQVALVFLAVDGLGKCALEALRHDPVPGLQTVSLVIGVAATGGLVLLAARSAASSSRVAASSGAHVPPIPYDP